MLALALALGLAACGDTADRAAAEPAAPATTPEPSPSIAAVAAALGGESGATPTEQAFADAVRAVAVSIADDSGKAALTNPDDVYTALRKAGLVGMDFDGTADYYAWSRPRRPFGLMGHNVMLVMAEDMREAGFIGCCVNRGVTLILHKDGDRPALQQFATETRCTLVPARDSLYFDTLSPALPPRVDPDELLALSCHERDILE